MTGRKAFACDFDGTLYRYDAEETISSADVEAIRAFQDGGGLFGVCSGRPPHAIALQPGNPIAFDFFVSVSGALVLGPKGEVISERRLPYEVMARIYSLCLPRSTALVIAAERDYYTVGLRGHYLIRDLISLSDLPPAIYGLSASTTSEEEASALAADIEAVYPGMVTAHRNVTGVDVVPVGCSKAAGLVRVKDALGIDVMAAMGDAHNDVAVLAAADWGYTFDDAPADLRACANECVSTVSEAVSAFAR